MKKKNIFLGMSLLAIAGLWTGCSSDGGNEPGDGISFHVQGGTPELRTTATTSASIQAFVVYGTDDLAAGNIFNGITIARQANQSFDYSPKKYYTANATTAQFAAYSPVSPNASAQTFALNTGISFSYTVPTPNPSGSASQEDLLVAGTTVTPSPVDVSLAFQHALSRVFVKATNSLNETVVIKELILKNLYSTGTIAGAPGIPWTWGWTPTGVRTNSYEYLLASSGIAVEANISTPILVTSMNQGMMILPQAIVNVSDNELTDFALEVVYDVPTSSITGQTTYVYLANGFTFDMGTQYAITINFTGASTNLIEINFDISVGTFADDPLTMP